MSLSLAGRESKSLSLETEEREIVPPRVSKSCNHAITQLCKILEDLCKVWTNEHKTVKTGPTLLVVTPVLK